MTAEPEMNAKIVLRQIAAAADHFAELNQVSRRGTNARIQCEAIALFTLRAQESDRLLVIAPKNAFSAWDEQLRICVPGAEEFVRLRGGRERIAGDAHHL